MADRYTLTLECGKTSVRALVGALRAKHEVGVVDRKEEPLDPAEIGYPFSPQLLGAKIRRLVSRVERQVGQEFREAYVALPAAEATSRRGVASRSISGSVSDQDLRDVLEAAQLDAIEAHEVVLSSRVVALRLDGQPVERPLGMLGSVLEVEVFYISCSELLLKSFDEALRAAKLEAKGYLIDIIASGVALVPASVLDQGIAVVDIGDTTTTVGIWARGGFAIYRVARVGAGSLAEDLAGMYRIPKSEALQLQRTWGCAPPSFAGEERRVGSGDKVHVIRRDQVYDFMRVHVTGLLESIEEEVIASGFAKEITRVVLTGGGSELPGMEALATHWFASRGIACRLGEHQPIQFGRERIAQGSLVTLGLFLESLREGGGTFYARVNDSPWKKTQRLIRKVLREFF